jgi:hypothetical protein
MKIDGAIKDAKTVTINAGETTSASFVVHEPILGSHSVQIAGLAAGFLVVEPEPAIITLHGTGTRATTAFTLERGLSIFHMVHRGTSNFIVWLYDTETGERVDLLANVIGSYDGSVVVGVTGESTGATPGEHLLDIDADGSWEVTIEQPRPVTAPSAPQTFTGTGPAVPQPFRLEAGTAIFHMSHQGTSNFAIWLYDRDGHRVELLVNEIGTFDGSTIVGVTSGGFGARPGIHYIAIDADGTWQVTLQQ